jgi:hypothetical protein
MKAVQLLCVAGERKREKREEEMEAECVFKGGETSQIFIRCEIIREMTW